MQNNSPLIRDIAERNVVVCAPELSISHAAKLMHDRRCSSIIIIENHIPVGIWTEMSALQINAADTESLNHTIATVMCTQLITIDIFSSLERAALKFKTFQTGHLIATHTDGTLFGILSKSDVVTNQTANHFLTIADIGSIQQLLPPKIETDEKISLAITMMGKAKLDALLVYKDQQPISILTTRDVVRTISEKTTEQPISTLGHKSLITAPTEMNLLSARALMVAKSIRHLAIRNKEGVITGLISFSDILTSIDHNYIARLQVSLENKEKELRTSERHLHMANVLINASRDGIMITNDKGIILSVNPAYTQLTGYTEAEAIGQPAKLTSSGKHDKAFYKHMWKSLTETGSWQGEIWNRRKSGEIYPELLTINKLQDPVTGNDLYSGVFSDVSELKKSKKIIENLAYYDPLTKLPNRQLLLDRLDLAIKQAEKDTKKLAVLLIDIDHFKHINDSLGHSVGDEVLKQVAQRLKEQLSTSDTLARIGGDEFITLISTPDTTTAFRKSQQLLSMLARPITLNNHDFFLSLSIGCAFYPEDGDNHNELIKNADTAMYRAKSRGRNQSCLYSPEMNAFFKQRLVLESQLRSALVRRELYLEYQPKISLKTGKIVGVEALIRWQNRKLGIVPPDKFIEIAEELGLIQDIGYWVLEEATRQGAKWQELVLQPILVSVNVSAKQFIGEQLIEQVNHVLSTSGLLPQNLDLEVTESCLMDNLALTHTNLSQLKNKGISVSLDDFGTGYSSLSKLHQLPLDTLKIDRSFIQDIPGNKETEALVSTIIFLAHKLGLSVVAEGIENQQQKRFLAQLDCEQMQGFYFSRPVSADNITAMLLENM